jgi:Tol biopolymer transport system component
LYSQELTGNGADQNVLIGDIEASPQNQSRQPIETGAWAALYAPSMQSRDGWLLFIQDGALRAHRFDPRSLQTSGDQITIEENFPPGSNMRPLSVSHDGSLEFRNGVSMAVRELSWFDRAGKRDETPVASGNINTVALSPDGTRAVVSRYEADGKNGDLWTYDLIRGTSARLTFEPPQDWIGMWSPDGRDITYASEPSGNTDIFRRPADGTGKASALLTTGSPEYPQMWSPDGKHLVYSAITATGLDLRVWHAADGKSEDYIKTPFSESQAQFSPDGRFIAYNSNATSRFEIYVQPFPNADGGKWMLSREGGVQPRWRRDGKELFFISADGKMMSVDVTLTGGFTAGAPKVLFQTPIFGLGGANNVFRYDVTPDGKRFLINSETAAQGANINVILGWEGLLKR